MKEEKEICPTCSGRGSLFKTRLDPFWRDPMRVELFFEDMNLFHEWKKLIEKATKIRRRLDTIRARKLKSRYPGLTIIQREVASGDAEFRTVLEAVICYIEEFESKKLDSKEGDES
jgi:hypothetical protein